MNKQAKYLDKVIEFMVKDTIIDYEQKIIRFPFFFSPPSSHLFPFPSLPPLPSTTFEKYCIDIYGLTVKETIYVWKQYKSIIEDKLKSKKSLNESTRLVKQNDYRKKIVSRMVEETLIDNSHDDGGQWTIYTPHMDRWIGVFGFLKPNFRHYNAFEKHVTTMYALGYEEVGFVWNTYIATMKTIIKQLVKPDDEDYIDNME